MLHVIVPAIVLVNLSAGLYQLLEFSSEREHESIVMGCQFILRSTPSHQRAVMARDWPFVFHYASSRIVKHPSMAQEVVPLLRETKTKFVMVHDYEWHPEYSSTFFRSSSEFDQVYANAGQRLRLHIHSTASLEP